MPELSPHAPQADRREGGRRRGKAPARNLATESGLRSRIRRILLVPAVAVVVGAAAVWGATRYSHDTQVKWAVAATAAAVCAVSLILAGRQAARVASAVHKQRVENATVARQWVERFEAVSVEGQKNVARLLEQVSRGERPQLPADSAESVPGGNPFADFEHTLRTGQHEALEAVAQAAARQQVDVFVNIAQRLHALVNRALARLDELESEVEDPDLLGGLFGVDHLVTQFRRQVESLAVMGGAVPRRINKPVPLPTVLRQGVAEIEQYARVRVIQPPEGTLPGFAAAEVIHLLAELVENAARFSSPDTQVTLRAERVPAGLAIEIDDRGLPMPADKLVRMNELLAKPDHFDIRAQLEDGRIGLFVVAQIARRHNIEVALRRNIYGGNQAVVVLPNALINALPDEAGPAVVANTAAAPAPVQAQSQGAGHAQQAHAPVATAARPAASVPAQRRGESSRPLPAESASGSVHSIGSQSQSRQSTSPRHGQSRGGAQSQPQSQPRGPVPAQVSAQPSRVPASSSSAGSAGSPSDASPAPLPQRRTAPPAPEAEETPAADGRPLLPKRSEMFRPPELPSLTEDRDREVVAPNPQLMARFASGIRLATADDSATGPTEPDSDHSDRTR